MKLSKKGLDLLRYLEGARNEAYLDSVGVWTIGVGHTGPEVVQGLKWTDQQVNDQLIEDLKIREDAVTALLTGLNIAQHEFDALVIFAFNVGLQGFKTSTLLKRIKAKAPLKDIVNAFLMWTKQPELTRRRVAEISRYCHLI